MKHILWILAVLSVTCSGAENSAKSLKEQIKVMVEELNTNDSQKVKSFIKKYAELEDLEKMIKSGKMDKFINKFMKKKQDTLRKALIKAEKLEPIVDENKSKYKFKLGAEKINGVANRSMTFKFSSKRNIFLLSN